MVRKQNGGRKRPAVDGYGTRQQASPVRQVSRKVPPRSWVPTDAKTALFMLVVISNLIIGVIHFVQTGDTATVMAVLGYAAAYVGLTEVTPFFARGKR